MAKKNVCPNCGGPLLLGVAHVCPVVPVPAVAPPAVVQAVETGSADLKAFLWKLAGGLVLAMIGQLLGAIWWAAKVQTTIDNFKEQLAGTQASFKEQIDKQQQTIERIDSYFRRPPQ